MPKQALAAICLILGCWSLGFAAKDHPGLYIASALMGFGAICMVIALAGLANQPRNRD